MMNAKEKQKVELRLQGAQVHLNYRYNNYRDGWKKKICDRPRSAINNSSLRKKFTETHRRPFSAGTKPQSPRFCQFLRHSTNTNLNNFDWNHHNKKTRISFPTTKIINTKQLPLTPSQCVISDDISEQGSEDSLVSLGSRIKAKARTKLMRYRLYSNLATKYSTFGEDARFMTSDKSDYNIKVNISNCNRKSTMEEELHSDDSLNGTDCKEVQPVLYNDSSAAIHTSTDSIASNQDNADKNTNNENNRPVRNDIVDERVSFGQHQPYNDSKNSEPFAKKNYLNLQQLSLVEEESILELDSLSSSESLEFVASEKSHDNEVKKTPMDASVEKEDQTKKYLNSRKESGTFILETSDFTKLWKNNEILEVTDKPIHTQYQCDNSQDCAIIMDKTDSKHQQCEIEKQLSDLSKQFSPTFSSTFNNHCKSQPFEKYLSENFNTLFESPKIRYTLPEPSSLPFSNTEVESNPGLQQDFEADPRSSSEFISLRNNTELQSAINYEKQCSWNMPNRDVDHTVHSIENSRKDHLMDKDKIIKEEITHMERNVNDQSEESYPTYLNNTLTKAYTTRALEEYKKEIDAMNNLHQLTLKDLKLSSSTPTRVNTERTDTTKRDMDLNTSKNISENLSAGVRRLDVCNIPTEELIQNYFDAKEDNSSKKNRSYYKNVPRKKSAGKKFNVSDAEVKNSNALTNNLIKAKKTCYSAPNLKCIEAKTHYRMQPLSARIECVQNDKDIESWVSTQIITPRVETLSDTNKSTSNPSDMKDLNVNIENVLDNKNNKTVTSANQIEQNNTNTSNAPDNVIVKVKELSESSTVLDIYSMLKEIERYGDPPVNNDQGDTAAQRDAHQGEHTAPKDNFQEIFTFLEKVEDSANEALSAVSPSAPITVPKLEGLLRLSHPELAQRVITAALQLEERSCCITLLQESLATHKEQTLARVTTLEKQSSKNISKVKQDCEEAIKRHQGFIDQLINDKKTLNHRIEQLVDERRQLDEKARRQARTLEERFKVELQTQHDKMAAAQQLARQRWVKQKAEKIKELTVKGLEGELRDMADRQQREVASMRLLHAEEVGRLQAQHEEQLRQLRDTLQNENESALIKERKICSTRLEKQILEIELTYQEQRTRLLTEMRAENEKAASLASQRDAQARQEIEKLRVEQEKELSERHAQLEAEMNKQKMQINEELEKQREKLEDEFAEYKRTVEAEHQVLLRKRIHEVTLQHKLERDREIEKAIDSMELEAQKGRKELQDALRRNKEQYECELRDVAETERAAQQRHRDTQARARLAEDKCGNLEITISQLESKLRIAEENIVQCQQRLLDMQKLTEAKWRSKYDDMRAQAEHMKSSHEEQMHQLYAKVKVAVARKDTAITALTRDNSKALEKVALLEQRLQQQRKDFLRQK